MKKYYITTPIYYVNDLPHIGHVFTTVLADYIARSKRNLGYDVYFLTGTDEHGQKAEKTAKQTGITPQELADRVVENYYKLWKQLNISYSDFIRTSESRHKKGAAEFFRIVHHNGDIYKGFYEGWYCVPCELILPESTKEEEACPNCGRIAEKKIKEESYFFRLSNYQERLLEYYRSHPGCIKPESRYNEVMRFVESGLRDLSVSRVSITWGVPVPGDPSHIIYVWFDALSNYITALGWSDNDALFKQYWPANIHLVGKDIVRFHCVYWPAFLMSAGIALPETIFGHGWWMMHSAKMSKTLGNVLKPEPLLKMLGSDPVRYFLLREAPLDTDSEISLESIIGRLNADLANDYGNLVSRTFQMIHKYFGGSLNKKPALDTAENSIINAFYSLKNQMDDYCTNLNLAEIFRQTWNIIYLLNKYIDEKQPWAKFKSPDNRDEVEGILYFICDFIRILSILLYPAMPESSTKLMDIFGIKPEEVTLEKTEYGQLPLGVQVPKSLILFPRLDIKEVLKQYEIE
ncbi:MAG: methionine--tRNA ligase [Candidatus Fischerbacteria bacterium RBG_13_37_8]|uniref:Methionine--tRNA ligase n=1 Tax=Candidatus Fischerbacteria bacterium RBG_13_37_8 TaxID=1817863 RepID=A0A1F5VI29_9BACT|nr:MAG: methionine--tRNA ligase [Candidatus Fischerbacteria bacterium RBG_13_37_8]